MNSISDLWSPRVLRFLTIAFSNEPRTHTHTRTLSHTHTMTGELFDHGLDSWAAILLPLCLMSAFGRGQPWGGTVYDAFPPCLAAVAGFYLSHWEKYITGVLYLPWFYDIIWLVRIPH